MEYIKTKCDSPNSVRFMPAENLKIDRCTYIEIIQGRQEYDPRHVKLMLRFRNFFNLDFCVDLWNAFLNDKTAFAEMMMGNIDDMKPFSKELVDRLAELDNEHRRKKST